MRALLEGKRVAVKTTDRLMNQYSFLPTKGK
jgi:hypothetical protein